MDSPTESETSTSQLPLLPQNPKPNRRRRTVVISFLLLLTLVAAAFTLDSYLHPSAALVGAPYFVNSRRYYCHLTPYPDLCFQSMSDTLDAASLESDPTRIFSNSIQIAINHLNSTVASISGNKTGSTECGKLLRQSLSRLNESMAVFREGYPIWWMTYQEMEDAVAGVADARKLSSRCLSNTTGVEEVKAGVVIARKCVANSLGLLRRRDRIVSEYDNRWVIDVEDYYLPSYYNFGYGMFYFVFSITYLFLGLLYYLLWRGDI